MVAGPQLATGVTRPPFVARRSFPSRYLHWGKVFAMRLVRLAAAIGIAVATVIVSAAAAAATPRTTGAGLHARSTTATAVTSAGAWDKAEEIPGIATTPYDLDVGGFNSLSCASAGNCAAGGGYNDGYWQTFVVNETKGTWGKAEEVPGTATLNAGGGASVNSISCVAARSCAAGGFYADASGPDETFVVDYIPASQSPNSRRTRGRAPARRSSRSPAPTSSR
jgi:hypothetical protein